MLTRVGGIFGLIVLLLWLYTIIDSITSPAERIRLLPKGVWVLIVLIFPPFGSVLWLIFGRPLRVAAGNTGAATASYGGASAGPTAFSAPSILGLGRSGSGRGQRRVAPDDDPEFLRKVADDLRRRSGNPKDPRDSDDK